MTGSALYAGSVFHRRLRPKAHRLRHSLTETLFDIDELAALDRRLRLFSLGRFNLFSFRPQDHGDGSGDLRGWVERELAAAGAPVRGGRIRLLCIPRILGHAFNPISVWFADGPDGRPAGIIYQVNNTFGERHSYVIPVEDASGPVVRQACAKQFHVSPFMDMDMTYRFTVALPGEAVSIRVDADDADGPKIQTGFAGRRRALTDRALLRAFLGQPLMTLKVVAGIGWGALRLWLKGIGYRPKPAPPAEATTRVRRKSSPVGAGGPRSGPERARAGRRASGPSPSDVNRPAAAAPAPSVSRLRAEPPSPWGKDPSRRS